MTLALPIDSDAIRETFRAWHDERESLDAQLIESLNALSAFQSHLDAWQRKLASERDELRTAREQLERDRAVAERSFGELSAISSELQTAREKITELSGLLLNRTDELRALDNRRAELQTELEVERARETDLTGALDEQKRSVDEERAQWSEELRQLRELLQRQLEEPPHVEEPVLAEEQTPQMLQPPSGPPADVVSPAPPRENPVLGSIVQQFDKLRQQRAVERQAASRPR